MLDWIPYFLGASWVWFVKWLALREMCSHVAHWFRRKEWVLFVPSVFFTLSAIGSSVLYVLGASYGLGKLGIAVPLQSVLLGAIGFGLGFYSPPFIQRIRHGEEIPRFYGAAWVEYHVPVVVCMPVPFNIVAGLLRKLWINIKCAGINLPTDSRDAYHLGKRDGYHQAIEDSQS